MGVEETTEPLRRRLHAELDELFVPERDWIAARPDLGRRIRRHRVRQALAAAASIVVVAGAAAVVTAGSQNRPGHGPVATRIPELASKSFGGTPAPQPAAYLTYGAGQLFAVVYGQRQTPVLRLDPRTLRTTGRLQASPAVPPVYGDGALWVAGGPRNTRLWEINPVTLRISRRLAVGGQLTTLVFSHGTLWLTACGSVTHSGVCARGRQRLERIDPATGLVTASGSVPIGGFGINLAVGPVILVSGPGSPVFAVDPRTLALRQTFRLRCPGCDAATGIAAGVGGLYAVSGSRVVRLDLATGRVVARGPQLPFSGPGILEETPGSLWLGTETGTFRLSPRTLTPTARVVAANQALADTGDTEQVLVADGSVYVSYSGGLARYPGGYTGR